MSSTNFTQFNIFSRSRHILEAVAKEKPKLLTVKFDLHTLAEFAAAVELNRARSVSEYVHRYAIRTIEEAKRKHSSDEFHAAYLKKVKEIEERSEQKARERTLANRRALKLSKISLEKTATNEELTRPKPKVPHKEAKKA